MSIRIHRPGKTTLYVLERDRSSENPTVFHLRPLTRDELEQLDLLSPLTPEQKRRALEITAKAMIENRPPTVEEAMLLSKEITDSEEMRRKSIKQMAYAVRTGLTRIEGLLDDENKPIDVEIDTFVQHCHADDLMELGRTIVERSSLPKDDRGNFGAPPAHGPGAAAATSARTSRPSRKTASRKSRSRG